MVDAAATTATRAQGEEKKPMGFLSCYNRVVSVALTRGGASSTKSLCTVYTDEAATTSSNQSCAKAVPECYNAGSTFQRPLQYTVCDVCWPQREKTTKGGEADADDCCDSPVKRMIEF